MEMRADVASANDGVGPLQSVVSKQRGNYVAYGEYIEAKVGHFAQEQRHTHTTVLRLCGICPGKPG